MQASYIFEICIAIQKILKNHSFVQFYKFQACSFWGIIEQAERKWR